MKRCKKRRINWRSVIYYLHKPPLSEAFTLFLVGHPDMSTNRCAYYVLKSNYSTTALKLWRKLFEVDGYDYSLIFGLSKINAYEM